MSFADAGGDPWLAQATAAAELVERIAANANHALGLDDASRRWRAGFDWRGLVERLGESAPAWLAALLAPWRAAVLHMLSGLEDGAGSVRRGCSDHQPETAPTHPRAAVRTLTAAPGAPCLWGSAAA